MSLMTVDIYIREKNGKREIRVPILPEKIGYKSGEATFIIYDIMNRGEVAVPTGAKLSALSWESEFPGEYRSKTSLLRGKWQDPKTYHSILEYWKENRSLLNVMVTGYPINIDVYVESYEGELAGAFGDIYYKLSFVESRKIVVTTTKLDTTTPTPTEPERPATTAKKYTIKSGDTLWGIAKKFYKKGSKWKTIYKANKTIIEKAAKKHGRKSSSNGHWIYPGTVIKIP